MVKFAVLGYGFMGKKHAEVVQTLPNATLNAIIDHHSLSQNSGFEYFQSLDFFLEQARDIDLVIIATPNDDHFPSAKRLLENGYNVIIEKPYCFTQKQAEHLQEIALNSGKKIFFIHQNRYAGTAKFLKNIIDNQLLGKIYMVQTNCFWSRGAAYYERGSWKGDAEHDGGTLYTQFFHFVDLIQWLFGDVQVAHQAFDTFRHQNLIDFEDTGSVLLRLKNGNGMANLNFSTAVHEKNLETSMTIIAEKGSVKIAGQYFNEVVYCNIEGFDLDQYEIAETSNLENLKENYLKIIEDLKTNAPIESGFNTVQIVEKIYSRERSIRE